MLLRIRQTSLGYAGAVERRIDEVGVTTLDGSFGGRQLGLP